MKLQDLSGEHWLDAVDFYSEYAPGDKREHCAAMRFRLDGRVYKIIEDPDDGYHSHMKSLTVDRDTTMKNVFPPIRVIGRCRDNSTYGDDVLELIDSATGGLVIEVGTENKYGYYPCFVAAFHPEEMAHNRPKGY